jgi:6-phosphogluconolactonase
MTLFANLPRRLAVAALVYSVGGMPALARTFVYVSNAEDGDIGIYSMQPDGGLQPGARVQSAKLVMPMAVSPDKRYLYAGCRSQPYSVHVYAIDAGTGALKPLSVSPLAESFPFISLDKTGHLTEVSSASGLPPDTKLGPGAPRVPAGSTNALPRNTENDIWAADIHMTPDGRFLYISERTSSILSGFSVDARTGALTYLGSTPTETQPRGFAIDPGGKLLIASGEKSETISVYAIDPSTGALRLLQKYPAGKGANWVEIVTFD